MLGALSLLVCMCVCVCVCARARARACMCARACVFLSGSCGGTIGVVYVRHVHARAVVSFVCAWTFLCRYRFNSNNSNSAAVPEAPHPVKHGAFFKHFEDVPDEYQQTATASTFDEKLFEVNDDKDESSARSVNVCVRACVRACVRVCVCVCVCVCEC